MALYRVCSDLTHLLTNSGISITVRTTDSPSQCANPLRVDSPCTDLCRPGEQSFCIIPPDLPYLLQLPSLFCAELRPGEPRKHLWVFLWQSAAFRNMHQRHRWSLLFWSQLLAGERSGSRGGLGASSSTLLGDQGCTRSDPLPAMNMGRFV